MSLHRTCNRCNHVREPAMVGRCPACRCPEYSLAHLTKAEREEMLRPSKKTRKAKPCTTT